MHKNIFFVPSMAADIN